MNCDGLCIGRAGEAGHDHAQILGIGKVHFAEVLRRATAHQVNVLDEFLKKLHALFALVARDVLGNAAGDGKAQVLVARAVEKHAACVNQCEFAAVARESDGGAFGELDAQAIGKNALHGGGFDPGDLLELATARVQGNAQDTTVEVRDKGIQYGFAVDPE